ncbi:MAG: hypothetical protein AAF735_06100 [Myxococcota bacterium]
MTSTEADSERPPSVRAMVGMVLVILGWLMTQSGFPPLEGDPGIEVSAELRGWARTIGPIVIVGGACLAALARLRAPLVLLVAGVVLNIGAEAGAIQPHGLGVIGVFAALAGALWASRQVRAGFSER